MKKIALLGSAPSSLHLAPFGDKSWDIWACSPGVYPHAKRVDAWFELHRWEPGKPWFSNEYVAFMAKLACPVYTIQPTEDVPGSVAYPLNEVMNHVYGHIVVLNGSVRELRFDPSDFSSTLAWMLAKAIIDGADVIGLWGVDMSAQEEWAFQRSGCQSLVKVAQDLGIEIVVPPESDLLRPPPLYGFCEVDPGHIKGTARRAEIVARINDANGRAQAAQREADHLRGALDDLEYQMKTWVGNPFHLSQSRSPLIAENVNDVTFSFDDGTELSVPMEADVKEDGYKSEPELDVGGFLADQQMAEDAADPVPSSPKTDDDWRAMEEWLDRGAAITQSSSLADQISVALSTLPRDHPVSQAREAELV